MKVLMADRTPPKAKKHKGKTVISPTSSTKTAKQSYSNPTFQLPADFDKDPKRYELWTVRLPIEIPLGDLDGIRIPLNHQDGGSDEQTFESGEKRYQVSWGKQLENESCRLLVQAKKSSKKNKDEDENSSSEEEEEEETEKEGFLYPSSRPFSRHLTVNEHFASLGERVLAPAPEDAPPAVDTLRRAYVSVPQRTNLRRRWQMPGARVPAAKTDDNDAVLAKPPPKRKLSEVDTTSKTPPAAAQSTEDQKPAAKRKLDETLVKEEKDDASETESTRKAAKRARKEAKKAKKEAKEAKRAKKAQKKMKKEQENNP